MLRSLQRIGFQLQRINVFDAIDDFLVLTLLRLEHLRFSGLLELDLGLSCLPEVQRGRLRLALNYFL